MASRHSPSTSAAQPDSKSTQSDEMLDDVEEDRAEIDAGIAVGDIGGLRVKLWELERKKEELTACQLKVDEDIQAVKRTMELVAAA